MQVAAEVMPANSLIIGVDLAPIKPIPRCIAFQSDITTDKCRATIRQHLKTWKADTVLFVFSALLFTHKLTHTVMTGHRMSVQHGLVTSTFLK